METAAAPKEVADNEPDADETAEPALLAEGSLLTVLLASGCEVGEVAGDCKELKNTDRAELRLLGSASTAFLSPLSEI